MSSILGDFKKKSGRHQSKIYELKIDPNGSRAINISLY